MALIGQEVSGERHIEIPKPVRDYFSGKLEDQDYDAGALEASLAHLPKVAAE